MNSNTLHRQLCGKMFVLAELEHTVRIRADQFQQAILQAIREQINRKLANKVIREVGLCITLKEILHISELMLIAGDAAFHTAVRFRYIMFRPPIGSVITGKIRSCSGEGVYVTLGFFDDILIPAQSLQYPSRFEEAEQAWVWEYPLSPTEKHDLYMDIGESIKFRVKDEIFQEISPTAHLHGNEVKSAYQILGSVNEAGLGILSWWQLPTEEEEDDDEEQPEQDATDEVEVEDEIENMDESEGEQGATGGATQAGVNVGTEQASEGNENDEEGEKEEEAEDEEPPYEELTVEEEALLLAQVNLENEEAGGVKTLLDHIN